MILITPKEKDARSEVDDVLEKHNCKLDCEISFPGTMSSDEKKLMEQSLNFLIKKGMRIRISIVEKK